MSEPSSLSHLHFMKDAYIYDESIEPLQQNNMTHGIIVDNQVLTAPEANVYTKVIKIVDDNKLLKQCLQENAHRLKQHVEELNLYKGEKKKTEESLRMEIEKEKQVAGSLQRKLDSAYEANGTKYIIKKMQGYLNALQQLITSSEESSGNSTESQEEANILTDVFQDINETFNDGYVIVSGSKKLEVILRESKDKLRSFHSSNAEKAIDSIEAMVVAIQESVSAQSSLSQDDYFQKYVEQKTSYESLAIEHQHLSQVQKENDQLKKKMDIIATENHNLKDELLQKSEKIKSLENLSVEFKLPTSDEHRLTINKLEAELDSCRKELETVCKHNQQLQNDLKENSETFEKSDQKVVELGRLVEQLRIQQQTPKQPDLSELENAHAQIEELMKCKAMLEKQLSEGVSKEKHTMDIKMYKKRENRNLDQMDQLKKDKKNLEDEVKKLKALKNSNEESDMEILISTESEPDEAEQRVSTPVVEEQYSSTESANPTEEVLNCKIADLQTELEELRRKLETLEQEKNIWEQAKNIWEHGKNIWDQEKSTWNQEKSTWEHQKSTWEHEKSTWEQEKNALEQQSSQHNEELTNIQLERFAEERKTFEEIIAQKDATIKRLTKESDDLKSCIQQQQREYKMSWDGLSQDYQIQNQTLDKAQREVNDLFNQLQEKVRLYNEKTAEYYAAESVIEKLRDENMKFKSALKTRELELKAHASELKNEKETLEILRVQVRVYENDFNAERSARETQSAEMQLLKENVESLRAERDQLRQELNRAANQSNFANIRDRHREGNPPPQSMPQDQHHYQQPRVEGQFFRSQQQGGWNQQQPGHSNYGNNPNIYGRGNENQNRKPESQDALHRPCPKCNELFPDLDTLQIHLIECIDD